SKCQLLIWEYFEESTCDLSRVIFKQCKQKVYKGLGKNMTTSSMRKHFESKHKPLYKEIVKI
ncbi:zinc finger BED domain-containing protein 4-like isoform X2, partial [Aphis craccivora]